MKELDVEQQIRKYCNQNRWHCLKLISLSTLGWPDRTIIKPLGEVVFLEIKHPVAGRVSDAQLNWITKLREYGHNAAIVRSLEEAQEVLG